MQLLLTPFGPHRPRPNKLIVVDGKGYPVTFPSSASPEEQQQIGLKLPGKKVPEAGQKVAGFALNAEQVSAFGKVVAEGAAATEQFSASGQVVDKVADPNKHAGEAGLGATGEVAAELPLLEANGLAVDREHAQAAGWATVGLTKPTLVDKKINEVVVVGLAPHMTPIRRSDHSNSETALGIASADDDSLLKAMKRKAAINLDDQFAPYGARPALLASPQALQAFVLPVVLIPV
uniref:Uncharacterized protein n=1 Tax=Oryza glumipatula TaxID=40148 RepID=A0A0D9ZX50_9ORYZ